MDNSACKGLDPDVFQLEQGQSARGAREVCNSCEVSSECLEYGLRTGSVGVWGGEVLTLKRGRPREVKPITLIDNVRPLVIKSPKRRTATAVPNTPGQIAARKAR